MKYLITLLLLLYSGLNNYLDIQFNFPEEKEDVWDTLVHRIMKVESEFNHSAIGDNGKAVGLFQIHPIMVREVNRITGEKLYSYTDRLDSIKSREMFEIYQAYYNPDKDLQLAAYLWNGGPRYYNNLSKVERYWNKVNNVEI